MWSTCFSTSTIHFQKQIFWTHSLINSLFSIVSDVLDGRDPLLSTIFLQNTLSPYSLGYQKKHLFLAHTYFCIDWSWAAQGVGPGCAVNPSLVYISHCCETPQLYPAAQPSHEGKQWHRRPSPTMQALPSSVMWWSVGCGHKRGQRTGSGKQKFIISQVLETRATQPGREMNFASKGVWARGNG